MILGKCIVTRLQISNRFSRTRAFSNQLKRPFINMKTSCAFLLVLLCGASAFLAPAPTGALRVPALRAFSDEPVAGDKHPPEKMSHEDKSEGKINNGKIQPVSKKIVYNEQLSASKHNTLLQHISMYCCITGMQLALINHADK
jgi:hypothetical protein